MSFKLIFLILGVLVLAACSAYLGKKAGTVTKSAEQQYPPTGQILDVDGTKIHVRIEGSGPNLLLIHGAGGNTRDFTFSLTDKLKSRFRTITIDRPGHGHTGRIETRAGEGESLAEQAALIRKALQQSGVDQALVLGQSYGGAVALRYALDHPEATQGLILVAGVSNPWEGKLDRWYRLTSTALGQAIFIPLASALASPERARRTVTDIFAPDAVPAGYLDHIGVAMALRPSQLRANTQQINRLLDDVKEQVTRYAEIDMPVEIIHGTADTTVPFDIHARPAAGQIKDASLTRLDGTGHMPHHAREAEVIEAITRAAKRAGL